MRSLEGGINPRLVDQHMRVVLPKNVAAALHVRQGDHVAFQVDGDEVRLRKVRLGLE
ncbi:MAG: AbrB/MazE/SpoVT family DNA-binding domain-containing protein [Halobacteriales archaeon]|nr:AbrB/MazE/SpoVT family DNA-binding domain-containing protein [Halobacteriales archaeon]